MIKNFILKSDLYDFLLIRIIDFLFKVFYFIYFHIMINLNF